MKRINNIENDIKTLKARNQRVEAGKAWETSYTRRSFIALFTYLSLALYMWAIDIERPWLNAIIPTVGFLFSTLSLPLIKRKWLKRHR